MISHPKPEQIDAFVMGHLRDEALEEHVISCEACSQRLAEAARVEETLYEFAAQREATVSAPWSSRTRNILVGSALAFAAAAAIPVAIYLHYAHNSAEPISRAPETLAAAKDAHGFDGWILAGSDQDAYVADLDTTNAHTGRTSGRLRSVRAPKADGFGTLMQRIVADDYLGKRVRFSAYVKTSALTKKSGLWMRIDRGSVMGGFYNMDDRPIRGTTDWARYEVVLDVTKDATRINFGVLMAGEGTTWIDDAKLEVVGLDVPVTSSDTRPLDFVNGDFESPEAIPKGWTLSGGGRANYVAQRDDQVKHSGNASARLEPTVPDPSGYGALLQSIRADAYRGQRVRATTYVRGFELQGRADMWLRVQGSDSPADGQGLGYASCQFTKTFDWFKCSLVVDVPQDAHGIDLGLGLGAGGTLWMDDMRLDVVPKNVPLTNPLPPASPHQLDFE
jgi:hypothetical protein